ncbi:MAG: Translation initiation factor IF-2, mitochondrial [Vezdaea acicularis]|nr:MAG: Translation initiation factor IF-2, mitochondrial [Vezdaea acicularis]
MRPLFSRQRFPLHQELCLLCASRLQRAPVPQCRPRPAQRRALQTTRSRLRPPGGAAAVALQEQDDDGWQPPVQSINARARASAAQLSAEELQKKSLAVKLLMERAKAPPEKQTFNMSDPIDRWLSQAEKKYRIKWRPEPEPKPLITMPESYARNEEREGLDDGAPRWGHLRKKEDRQGSINAAGKEVGVYDPMVVRKQPESSEPALDRFFLRRQSRARAAQGTELEDQGSFGYGYGERFDPRNNLVSRINQKHGYNNRTEEYGPGKYSQLENGRTEGYNSDRGRQFRSSSYEPGMSPREQARLDAQRRREAKFSNKQGPAPSLRYEGKVKGAYKEKARRRGSFAAAYEPEKEEAAEAQKRAEERRQRRMEREMGPRTARPIKIPEFISVGNLAQALNIKAESFAYKLEELGFDSSNHDFILNAENAGLIAMEYNYEPIVDQASALDLQARPALEDKSAFTPRPPVVTIMGHVDHGKTTILDYLRKSSVAATEHGGITQHIGAFSVPMPSGKTITFLDTPGHAAFLSMRQRGANVTDIVVLVVAADDSVKPQTIEAIKHARAAKVPMIVAINKIDKEGANIQRVKEDLARQSVDVEDFGGDTQVVCVSGKTGKGMDELEEAVVALSDVLDIRADPSGGIEGWVLEATTKPEGRVATVLVRSGTLRIGDVLVAGSTWARVRRLRNEAGTEVDQATPGQPIEVDGWREQAAAGDEVLAAEDEAHAKDVIGYRVARDEKLRLALDVEAINAARLADQEKRAHDKELKEKGEATAQGANAEKESVKEVYFIVKGDVSGSVEAVVNSIASLGNEEVRANVLRSGVGPVSEFDVEHAAAAKGFVLNFNVGVEPGIQRLADALGVKILDENIIYKLVDEVKAVMSGFLRPTRSTRVLGEAEVAQVFSINTKGRKVRSVAGCKVRNGVIGKNAMIRVLRGGPGGAVVFDGRLEELKNVKKDVEEMRKGSECGMAFADWDGFVVGDQVQAYEEKEEKRCL